MKKLLLASICALLSALYVQAQQEVINLPSPQKTGGKPLMEALNERKSVRSYSGTELDSQTISNLLWAANGFNRPDKRTAPSANNKQEIDIYVLFKNGIYFYEPTDHKLTLVAAGDFINTMGNQEFVKDAALHLIFVGNLDKSKAVDIDTGYISQNVYLYCASAGLGTVARGSFDKEKLPPALKLTENQRVTLVHPVGIIK